MKRIIFILKLSTVTLLVACQNTEKTTHQITQQHSPMSNFEINKTEEEWKKTLSEEQYHVLREKGTERAFTGKYNLHFEKGKYHCAACGYELFDSESKFESHCGWPSFDNEIGNGRIKKHTDSSFGMTRTEIVCGKCGGHLGHLFDDGPTSTGLRYCVNSASIDFKSVNDSLQ